MSLYASSTPTQERYLDFRAAISSSNLNKKQVRFWTDADKFILRGLKVTHDPSTNTVTVTNGAAVKDDVLIVLPSSVNLTYSVSLGQCIVVALEYVYITNTCPSGCKIVVIDAADYNSSNMLLLAMIDSNGNVVYPKDTTTPINPGSCYPPEPRIEFSQVNNSAKLARATFSPSSTTNSIPLLVDASSNEKILIYLNGALMEENVDYTIDRSVPGNFRIIFTVNLYTYDVIEEIAVGGYTI